MIQQTRIVAFGAVLGVFLSLALGGIVAMKARAAHETAWGAEHTANELKKAVAPLGAQGARVDALEAQVKELAAKVETLTRQVNLLEAGRPGDGAMGGMGAPPVDEATARKMFEQMFGGAPGSGGAAGSPMGPGGAGNAMMEAAQRAALQMMQNLPAAVGAAGSQPGAPAIPGGADFANAGRDPAATQRWLQQMQQDADRQVQEHQRRRDEALRQLEEGGSGGDPGALPR